VARKPGPEKVRKMWPGVEEKKWCRKTGLETEPDQVNAIRGRKIGVRKGMTVGS
jgi:hypothetical protein